jgi:hypothetical protein
MDPDPSNRQALHSILLGFMPEGGNVYFQPPENIQMTYPCIVYQRDYALNLNADNGTYHHRKRYQVTIIDKDPDSDIPDKVAAMSYSAFLRFFVTDNLNHDVYNVYF